MRNALALSLWLAGLLAGSAASAGTLVSTISGQTSLIVFPGVLVTVDSVLTFGPTTVGGGFGADIEVSFDFAGGTSSPGSTTVPPGWFDLSGGSYFCAAGHCENIVAAGDFGFGAPLPSGATFALPSITIDTTGLAPGVYAVGAGFTGPGDGIRNPGPVDLTGEYTTSGATIIIGDPVPSIGAAGQGFLALALALSALAATRRSS